MSTSSSTSVTTPGAKAGEFFTPPAVVDLLVRMLEPRPGDTVYDPTSGSGGMLVHSGDYPREQGHPVTSARYFAQEMNWGNAAIGKINSVLHGLDADIKRGPAPLERARGVASEASLFSH
jgi:type I restriction enzyme M protein